MRCLNSCKPYQYILQIIQDESISIAAESLHISQPALSKYVHKIEKEFGATIFDRSTVPISLTDAGKCYVEASRKILDVNKQLQKELDEINNEKNECIRVGISPSRAPYLLPYILHSFDEENKARIVIVEATTTELNSMLSTGELDLIISITESSIPENFCKVHLFDEDILLAIPRRCGAISFDEALTNNSMISSGIGQPMWNILSVIIDRMKLPPPRYECQNMFTAIQLADDGLGVTLVPSYMRDFGPDMENVQFLSVPKDYGDLKREVCIFYRREQYLSKSEKEFIKCATDSIKGAKAQEEI